MTQEITDEKPAITESYPGFAELVRRFERVEKQVAKMYVESADHTRILAKLEALIPAMEAASKLLDNPVTRWKGRHVKGN